MGRGPGFCHSPSAGWCILVQCLWIKTKIKCQTDLIYLNMLLWSTLRAMRNQQWAKGSTQRVLERRIRQRERAKSSCRWSLGTKEVKTGIPPPSLPWYIDCSDSISNSPGCELPLSLLIDPQNLANQMPQSDFSSDGRAKMRFRALSSNQILCSCQIYLKNPMGRRFRDTVRGTRWDNCHCRLDSWGACFLCSGPHHNVYH